MGSSSCSRSLLCVPVIGLALGFGRTGAVTAIMIASLPIMLFQTPGRIVLLREMRYDRTLAIEVGAQMSFQGFAVVAVVLGAGVWDSPSRLSSKPSWGHCSPPLSASGSFNLRCAGGEASAN